MSNLQKETKEKLIAVIKECKLEKHTDELLKVARECIRVVATDEIDDFTIGESRIGGPPDLEAESQWPPYGYGERKHALSVFYFQVNLEDLPFVIGPSLPKKGLLSVFSTSQNQLEDDGTLLYFEDVEKLSIQRLPSIDEFGDEDLDLETNIAVCFRRPRKIKFEISISLPRYLYLPDFIDDDDLENYLEIESRFPKILSGQQIGYTYSYFYHGMPEEDDPNWFTLFNLDSDSDYFSFGDCGNCGISLLRSKAKAMDFSEAIFCYCE